VKCGKDSNSHYLLAREKGIKINGLLYYTTLNTAVVIAKREWIDCTIESIYDEVNEIEDNMIGYLPNSIILKKVKLGNSHIYTAFFRSNLCLEYNEWPGRPIFMGEVKMRNLEHEIDDRCRDAKIDDSVFLLNDIQR
jgi:hypothetical protein